MTRPAEITNVCPGCDVREPWEHRCFGEGCHCEECKQHSPYRVSEHPIGCLCESCSAGHVWGARDPRSRNHDE